jgi:hypothetical protein
MLVHVASFCPLTNVTADVLPVSLYLAADVDDMLVHVVSFCPLTFVTLMACLNHHIWLQTLMPNLLLCTHWHLVYVAFIPKVVYPIIGCLVRHADHMAADVDDMLLELFDSTADEAMQQGFDPVGKLLLQQRLQQQQQHTSGQQQQQPRQPARQQQQQQPDSAQQSDDAVRQMQEVQEMLKLLLSPQANDGLHHHHHHQQQQQHGSWQQRNGYVQPTAGAAGLEAEADQLARVRW